MLLHETDLRFTIAPSTIPGAGNGLFAAEPLAARDRLEVVGVLVAAGSVADTCTAFADAHKFRVGDRLLIPVGYAGMVNHSNTPNLEKVIDGERVFLRTLRSIQRGEEVFFRYSDYAQERFGLR
jgi:SET domain